MYAAECSSTFTIRAVLWRLLQEVVAGTLGHGDAARVTEARQNNEECNTARNASDLPVRVVRGRWALRFALLGAAGLTFTV